MNKRTFVKDLKARLDILMESSDGSSSDLGDLIKEDKELGSILDSGFEHFRFIRHYDHLNYKFFADGYGHMEGIVHMIFKDHGIPITWASCELFERMVEKTRWRKA